jgi:hypothetical protein
LTPNSKRSFERLATGIVLSVTAFLFLYQLYLIHKYAVEIPYMDDWTMFGPGRPAKLSVAWLLDASNTRPTASEHVIAPTKLLVWMQYHLNGWNFSLNLVLNFLLFGLFIAWIAWFADQAVPDIPRYAKLAFIIFLLSPIDWFNHFMATQTCYLFYLIFFFLGSYLLFKDNQHWWHIVAGSLLSLLSIYTLASGFGSSLVLVIAFCVFKGARVYSETNSARRIRETLQLAVTVFFIGGALSFWIAQYVTPPHVNLVLPSDLRFWQFFVNLVSFGFGVETFSSWWGTFCLLVVVVPICAIIWRRKGKLTSIEWTCVVMATGLLLNVGEIAAGRASPSVAAGSKALRYVEFVLPLIPLSMIMWAVLLRERKRLKAATLAGLFAFCWLAFANDWRFDGYEHEAARRIEGRACVKEYYKGIGDGRCPTVYSVTPAHIPLSTWLDGARAVNASFYKNIREEIETENQQQPGAR